MFSFYFNFIINVSALAFNQFSKIIATITSLISFLSIRLIIEHSTLK